MDGWMGQRMNDCSSRWTDRLPSHILLPKGLFLHTWPEGGHSGGGIGWAEAHTWEGKKGAEVPIIQKEGKEKAGEREQ